MRIINRAVWAACIYRGERQREGEREGDRVKNRARWREKKSDVHQKE